MPPVPVRARPLLRLPLPLRLRPPLQPRPRRPAAANPEPRPPPPRAQSKLLASVASGSPSEVEITTIMFFASAPPTVRGPSVVAAGGVDAAAAFGTALSRSAVDQLAAMLVANRGLRAVLADDLLHDAQIIQLDEALAGRQLHCDTIR